MSKTLKGFSNLMQFAATNGVLKEKLEKLAKGFERSLQVDLEPSPETKTFQNVKC